MGASQQQCQGWEERRQGLGWEASSGRKACPWCRMAEARQPRLQAPAGAPLRPGGHQSVGPLRASRLSVLPVLAARRGSLVLAQQLKG